MHDLETPRFRAFLMDQAPELGELLFAERYKGGQSNPTYRLTTSNGTYVLRARPLGKLLKSAHQVEREFRVMEALHDTSVPVARPIYLSPTETPLGAQFYVMEHLDGDIHWDPALPDCAVSSRADITLGMATVLATLHGVNPDSVDLGDFGPQGSYVDRQLGRWSKQYLSVVERPSADVEALIAWLKVHKPISDSARCVVHGDFRLDNLIFEHGTANVMGILDWELSTLGDPLSDLAYWCMCLRLPRQGLVKGLAGVNRAAEGLPLEQEIIEHYRRVRGLTDLPDWDFYLAFSYFRLISILEGVMARARAGNAANPTGQDDMQSAVAQLTADALLAAGIEGSR